MSDKIKVLVVEPMEPCRVQEIPDTLEAMQAIVDGHIQAVYPFHDEVALVCNEEGKHMDLPYNRPLTNDQGVPYDMICGTFFLAGLGSEDFISLTEDQIQRYKAMYDNMVVLTAEAPVTQEEMPLDSGLRDFAVSCEVVIHFDGEDAAAKEALTQRITEIYNDDTELSDRTVGSLEFEFGDSQVKVQYGFARRDSSEANAEMFSEQCVRRVQDQIEGSGYRIGEIDCYAIELEPDPIPRQTPNKKKGTHHER